MTNANAIAKTPILTLHLKLTIMEIAMAITQVTKITLLLTGYTPLNNLILNSFE